MTSYTRLALLALVLCAFLIAGARHASAAVKSRTASTVLGDRAVKFVNDHFGRALPHSSYAQFGAGRRVARGALRPGDLVFFDSVGHVGIYIGGGRFIHAPHSGLRVKIDSLGESWYSARYDGARRLA
jgi:hypothetical protein